MFFFLAKPDLVDIFQIPQQETKIWAKPVTPKIWLLILSSSCLEFPCKIVTIIIIKLFGVRPR